MHSTIRLFFLLLFALLCSCLTAAELTLTWADNSDNEVQFSLERAEGADGEFAELARVDADVTTYTDSELKPSTVYRYRVRAGNASGWSEYSNIAEAETYPHPPAAPGDVKAERPPPVVVLLPRGRDLLVTASP